ncbi:MAG: aldose 1-epimerase [Actinomycetaceae bacterium]|nr:aldose 1-epimerase [Actinomycetaceae bacterium]MDU0970950.1 aldose 1-epimerase [Actinomycetaceae bacterium]
MANKTWTLRSGDDTAEISAFGAIALSWKVKRGDELVELLDGYASDEEREELHGYRNAVLAPWSNRIADSRFSFGGHDVDLGPDAEGVREGLHGLIAAKQFVELDRAEDWIQLACQVGGEGQDYPFSVQVHVLYRLYGTDGKHRLELTIKAANTGTEDAPITLGWHPYLRYIAPKQLAQVTIPASEVVRTNAANIPLEGDEAFVAAEDSAAAGVFPEGVDVSAGEDGFIITGPADLDHAFTSLTVDPDGWARGYLAYGDGSATTVEFVPDTVSRGIGIFQVFTGEVLPERGGEAIAFEPCLAMTDAFNRTECSEWVTVAPGDVRELRAALSFSEHAE